MIKVSFDTLDFDIMLKRCYEALRQECSTPNIKGFPVSWLRWSDREWINEFSFEDLREQIKQDTHKAPRIRHFGGSSLEDLVAQYKKLQPNQVDQIETGIMVTIDNCTFMPVMSPRSKNILGVLAWTAPYQGQQLLQIQSKLMPWLTPLDLSLEHWSAVHLSLTDDVTGLFNQRYLPQVLSQEILRAQRSKENFSVLFIDMDHFKKVNDNRGHLTGSKLLQQMAHLLKRCVRAYDFCFRYGGDEFLVVMTNCPQSDAESVAERIRVTVEKTTFIADQQSLNLTVSIGIATFPVHAQTSEQLIRMADEAMYDAKNRSRNIVFVAS